MRVLDIVIDFVASVQGTVLQNFMTLTGDSPQTPETAPTWVNVETFSAVGELLDRRAGQFSHALLNVNSQCSAPMAAISCFSLPFTAALKKRQNVLLQTPECWRETSTRSQTPTTQWRSASLGRDTSQSRERQKLSVESPVSSSGHKQAVVLDSRNDWWTVFFDEQIAKVSTRQGFHVHHEDAQASSISWSITIGSAAAGSGRDHVSSPFARTSHGFNAVFT